MNTFESISRSREQLAADINSLREPIPPAPLNISIWLASSLLQKAIRRGNETLALGAAATLMWDDPVRLWRRCGVIAYEDIGVADIETVALVTAALTGKIWRSKIGGEWAIASNIVSRMARAPKCRSTDDLLMAIERHPDLANARSALASAPTLELMDIAVGGAPLPERALALWYAVGTTRRPSDNLQPRRGDPQLTFDKLEEAGFPESIVELSRAGFKKIGEILCPLMTLLFPISRAEPSQFVDDSFPPEIMIGDAPSWAFDMYVREGRRAIHAFIKSDCETMQWARDHAPEAKQFNFIAYILFVVESGLLKRRLQWETATSLRHLSEYESQGSWCPDAHDVIELLRADIPLLNSIRADLIGGNS